jgi:hypothetical protein
MQNKFLIIFYLFSVSVSNAQYNQQNSDYLRKIPKYFEVQIYEQTKGSKNTFKTKKQTFYRIWFKNNLIEKQIVNDTLVDKTSFNRLYLYKYDANDNLISRVKKDTKGDLKSEISYVYQNDKILKKEIKNEFDKVVKTYSYLYGNCESEYLNNLMNDNELEHPNDYYNCITETIKDAYTNQKYVAVYDRGNNLVKDIKFDSVNKFIKSYTRYNYYDSFDVEDAFITKNNEEEQFKMSYEYNKFGNIILYATPNTVVKYTYEYDKYNNWTKKIETGTNRKKRIVTKRKFNY